MIEITQNGAIGTIRLNRPEVRNALTGEMLRDLAAGVMNFDADPEVRVIILTGADPAFCAGLDLRDLANIYNGAIVKPAPGQTTRGLMPASSTPIIGVVNGPAVTGGLELALGCDFLIASREHATFADTHARVGIMPAGGMTIRLPQLVGVNRARQMSLTGDFISATTACDWGLVNEVCAHEVLLARAQVLAQSIADCDPLAVSKIRSMYEELAHRSDAEAYREEAKISREWMKERFNPSVFEESRSGIIKRGSAQQ
ncbi:MAG: enoyl-CoA hydratase [Actinomycetota bacterium]|jgi:enoyl-CoA hydratase